MSSIEKSTKPRKTTKSRSKANNSEISEFIPDMSPIAVKSIKPSKRITAAKVIAEFDDPKPKLPPKITQPSVPPVSGRSKPFKPLLLRSKPSTEGFKMPKARSKQVAKPVSQGGTFTTGGTVLNSSILQRYAFFLTVQLCKKFIFRTGRISSAVFLKRMQRSLCLAPGEESFDEVELTKE